MIDQNNLNSLLSHESDNKSLSVYLKVDPGLINLRPLKTVYKNLLKNLSAKTRKALHEEINTISNLIENTPPTGKDLAIFAGGGHIYPYSFDENFPYNLIDSGDKFCLFPVAHIEQFTPTVLATIVQQKETQLFRIDGDIKRLLAIKKKDEPRKNRHGFFHKKFGLRGGSTPENRNKQEQVILSFMQDTSVKISQRIDRELSRIKHRSMEIIIGEPQHTEVFFEDRPRARRSDISFVNSIMGYPRQKDLKKICRSLVRKELTKKIKLAVKTAMSAGSKGGAVSATHALTALQEGRAKELVLSIKTKISGTVCTKCGYTLVATVKACPVCAGKTQRKSDITEDIYRLAHKYAENTYLTAKKLPIGTPVVATFRY